MSDHINALFKKILGKDDIITNVVENEKYYFAFFQSKAFVNSNNNDKYIQVGHGPLLYNKLSGEYKKLGSLEFVNQYYDPSLFPDQKEKVFSYEELKENIIKRKHINFDEFEEIFSFLGINLREVMMSSDDNRFFIIKLKSEKDIQDLIKFLKNAKLPYKKLDDFQIELDNG